MPLLPEGRSLYINAPLTNISVGYQQGPNARNWIAPQVFPQVPVQRQGDLYWKYDKGDWFRSIAGVRAPATESPGGGWQVSTDSYFCHVYAVHKDVDDQTRANADAGGAFNLERDATQWVTQNLLIKRDRLFVDSFLKTGVWTGGTGIGGGADAADLTGGAAAGNNTFVQWDRSGSDPIKDIATQVLGMARRTGFRPNVLVIGPDVYNAMLQNTSIIERIKYSERGLISEELLRTVFGVDRIVVTWTIENTAPMGATDAMGFMNSKSALLVYAPNNPGLMQPSGGYIFTWAGFLGAGSFGTRIRRFRMEPTQSERIEGEMAFDMKVVAPDTGIFFSGAVQ
jgi:hypothetical protein